ncbi:tigger transposable element-derived protein 6-like [Anastrepha ludens]|uniref:tigger transposable element-derived protein 6-like n=1 Tax=Anastrepha ludens TaxID=28586 RepID=UPI0023B1DB50|nr:tigger transposable element-derived protein 6-like [Anastrepha ludens]
MRMVAFKVRNNMAPKKKVQYWQNGSEGGSEIVKMCFNCFAKARSQNIPISGPILKAKAMEIAGKLGVPNFNASDGWLNKWRIRNNVAFKCVYGEAADVNQDGVEQFRTKLPSLLTGYKPQDIYNADESGLFFVPYLTKPSLLNRKNAWAVNTKECKYSLLPKISLCGIYFVTSSLISGHLP